MWVAVRYPIVLAVSSGTPMTLLASLSRLLAPRADLAPGRATRSPGKERTEMDPTKFDALTKALATSTSRRQALKTIAATTIGSILGLGGIGTAFAKCKDTGHNCSKDEHCCSKVCCNGKCCAPGLVCNNGQCVTPCEGLGLPCTSDSQCCSGFCSSTICGGAGVCCGVLTPCTSDSDCCCGGLCISGTCTCFTAGTLIAMADGTSRPIELVLVGDLVLGNAGQVNRVTEVLLPVLGHRPLYSLNGSNFFVTSGHPFMTEEGWKAVDPTAVLAQLSELHVDQLTLGDRLLTLTAAAVPVGGGRASSAEAVDVRIEAVALHSLVGQPADPATQLYNLRLDGEHTYFANDLLVHNK